MSAPASELSETPDSPCDADLGTPESVLLGEMLSWYSVHAAHDLTGTSSQVTSADVCDSLGNLNSIILATIVSFVCTNAGGTTSGTSGRSTPGMCIIMCCAAKGIYKR